MAVFAGPTSSAAVNGGADVGFLAGRLAAYVAALQAGVWAVLPGAAFELLWPLDVNDPASAPLCLAVNLPAAWKTRSGSGFDTFVCEGLSYGADAHDVGKAAVAAGYPFQVLGWDAAHCRYLMEWFSAGSPWVAEYLAAGLTGVPVIKAWAWDHLCLMGWSVPMPAASGRVRLLVS